MYAAAKGDTKEMERFVKVNPFIRIRYVEYLTPYHGTHLILTISL